MMGGRGKPDGDIYNAKKQGQKEQRRRIRKLLFKIRKS